MTTTLPEQTSSLDFQLLLLPYQDEQAQKASLSQLQRSLGLDAPHEIIRAQLERLIANSADEHDDQELSLQDLEGLSGGVGLVDAMVSSSILMVIVSQSAGLFGNSMDALNKSTLRDGINGAISADIELVRHDVASWAQGDGLDGQLRYEPDASACDAGTLGQALLSDSSSGVTAGTTQVSLDSATNRLQGMTINRTISLDPENSNLIRISYATADGSAINVNQSATLATPAQGWCP